MAKEIKVSRFFTIPVHELFGYFIDPVLLKRWCYPEGMSLKEVHFDPYGEGSYHFEHANEDGETYVCDGHIHKLVPNEYLSMVDDVVKDPKGMILEEKLNCEVRFHAYGSGSGVEIVQSGFRTEEGALNCATSWQQCLDHLHELVKDSGLRQFRSQEPTLSGTPSEAPEQNS